MRYTDVPVDIDSYVGGRIKNVLVDIILRNIEGWKEICEISYNPIKLIIKILMTASNLS